MLGLKHNAPTAILLTTRSEENGETGTIGRPRVPAMTRTPNRVVRSGCCQQTKPRNMS